VPILGGNGYTREFPVERWHPRREDLHDLRGTSEILRMIIGRALTGLDGR
jgi:alkylation response protein AidB-like acyl-CoA dehydrogenase